jgi:hypothetical protein
MEKKKKKKKFKIRIRRQRKTVQSKVEEGPELIRYHFTTVKLDKQPVTILTITDAPSRVNFESSKQYTLRLAPYKMIYLNFQRLEFHVAPCKIVIGSDASDTKELSERITHAIVQFNEYQVSRWEEKKAERIREAAARVEMKKLEEEQRLRQEAAGKNPNFPQAILTKDLVPGRWYQEIHTHLFGSSRYGSKFQFMHLSSKKGWFWARLLYSDHIARVAEQNLGDIGCEKYEGSFGGNWNNTNYLVEIDTP